MPLRVIKLGGSLLDWPELPGRFRRWLAAQEAASNVLIVGGGPIVESLRSIDRVHRLSIEATHWLAIEAMSLTAQLASELWPEARLIRGLDQFESSPNSPLQILDVEPLLRAEQGSDEALPSGWDVTSDSIAAHVANRLLAAELVLIKSTLPSSDVSQAAATKSYVDEYFATAAHGRAVRCVNLRDAGLAETVLQFD